MYRYYLRSRPPGIGCMPDGYPEFKCWYPDNRQVLDHPAGPWWYCGWVEYEEPLSDEQVRHFSLIPADPQAFLSYQIKQQATYPSNVAECWSLDRSFLEDAAKHGDYVVELVLQAIAAGMTLADVYPPDVCEQVGELEEALKGWRKTLENLSWDVMVIETGSAEYKPGLADAYWDAHREVRRLEAELADKLPPKPADEWLERWVEIGKGNAWISRAVDPPFGHEQLCECYSSRHLAARVLGASWNLGAGFYWGDQCWINQINGGDEWLVIKQGRSFESVTSRAVAGERYPDYKVKEPERLVALIELYAAEDPEKLYHLEYEFEWNPDRALHPSDGAMVEAMGPEPEDKATGNLNDALDRFEDAMWEDGYHQVSYADLVGDE